MKKGRSEKPVNKRSSNNLVHLFYKKNSRDRRRLNAAWLHGPLRGNKGFPERNLFCRGSCEWNRLTEKRARKTLDAMSSNHTVRKGFAQSTPGAGLGRSMHVTGNRTCTATPPVYLVKPVPPPSPPAAACCPPCCA